MADRKASPELVVRATLKKTVGSSSVQAIFKEVAFYEHFKGTRGIIQLRSCCNYTEIISNRARSTTRREVRPSLIFKKYDGSLLVALTNNKQFNFDQQLAISEDLIYGLATIHGRGIVHGDLKLENALYTLDCFGRVVAVHSDLGNAFDLWKQEPAYYTYRCGYYGSFLNTAPELFGVSDFKGNVMKTEVWALGIMLHEIHFGTTPTWTKTIHQMHTTNFANGVHKNPGLLKKAQGYVLDQIQREVLFELSQFENLENRRPLTKKERFRRLIFRMLHPEPDNRIVLSDAKLEIAQIKG
jgi:serine/threonine protein kinase